MNNQYDDILMQILDAARPNPIVAVANDSQFGILRAGLSASKKSYNTLMEITGGDSLSDKKFKYTRDPENYTKITISLEDNIPTEFTILNPG